MGTEERQYGRNRIMKKMHHFIVVFTVSQCTHLFFSLMRGGRIQIPLLAGHQLPASETPFI